MYPNPVKTRRSPLPIIGAIILTSITTALLQVAITRDSFSNPDAYYYVFFVVSITHVAFFIGIIVGYRKKLRLLPKLDQENSKEIRYKTWHIISVVKNLEMPGMKQGYYSVPASMLLGYRITAKMKTSHDDEARAKDTWPTGYGIEMIFRNDSRFEMVSKNSLPIESYNKIHEAINVSLRAMDQDPSKSASIKRWNVIGIPDDVQLDRVNKVHAEKIPGLPKIKKKKPKKAELSTNFPLLMQCSVCHKEIPPRKLKIKDDWYKKDSGQYTCQSCLGRYVQEKIELHNSYINGWNNVNRFIIRGLPEKVTNMMKKAKKMGKRDLIGRSIAGSMLILAMVAIIVIFTVILQLMMFILAEIYVFIAIYITGLFIAPKPVTSISLKQVISIDGGLSQEAHGFVKRKHNIKIPLETIKKSGKYNAWMVAAIMTVILLLAAVIARLEFLLSYMSLIIDCQSFFVFVLPVLIPVILITMSVFITSLTFTTNTIYLNELNFYIPPRYWYTEN
jgi:hypothetical protein